MATGHREAAFLAAGAAALWGTSYPAIGIAIRDADPLSIALTRGVGQAVLLGAAVLLVRHRLLPPAHVPQPPRRRQLAALAGLGLLGGFFNVGQAVSVELSGAVATAFVAGLYPVLTVVLAALLLGEGLPRRGLAGCLLAALGVLLLANPERLDPEHLAGLVLAATAALTFAGYLVASRRAMATFAIPPLLTTFAVFIGVATESVVAIALTGASPRPSSVSPAFLAAIVWLVVGSGVVPLVMSELSVRRAPLLRTSPFLFIAPLVAAAIGLGPLGESLAPVQLAGGALTVLGIVAATTIGVPALVSGPSNEGDERHGADP